MNNFGYQLLSKSTFAILLVTAVSGCNHSTNLPNNAGSASNQTLTLESPESTLKLDVKLENGEAFYRLWRDSRPIVSWSKLGFEVQQCDDFSESLSLQSQKQASFDQVWTQPWGEEKDIRNRYEQLSVSFRTDCDLVPDLHVAFRLFDDGLGFRYDLKANSKSTPLTITGEHTEYAFVDNLEAWWIPAMEDIRYEYLYKNDPIDELHKPIHTPLTLEGDQLYVSIHEAALVDFPSMAIQRNSAGKLQSKLIPWSDGTAAKGVGFLQSSWRTIQVADQPGDLITSYLVLNLNEPSVIDDLSWIEPSKYGAIWWDFHIKRASRQTGPEFGATTERAKEYIDFYSQYDIPGFLVESWNLGWDGNWGSNGDKMDFITAHPDYDFKAVANYAKERGMYLIAHNETAANTINYEKQLDEAYSFYAANNVKALKTGYVGPRLDDTEWHHGQYGVRHFHTVMETAARYELMVNAHEPIKDTGLRRTYPNFMTREGARGQEFNAWGENGGNTVDHTTILPFTRMLAGPMDFTPGIFNFDYQDTRPGKRVPTTLAKQLALYVVLYSSQHNVTDRPDNYRDHPAFKFIEDVPVDWSRTKVLNGKIGDYVTIARQDRNSSDWYLGAITDGNARTMDLSLSFLDPDVVYQAEIYKDGNSADWQSNPEDYALETLEGITSKSVLQASLAPGGGMAVRFKALSR